MFSYDPPTRNHHNKVLYCLMDHNHIYTLNHDIKRLEQKHDEDDKYVLNVSYDFRVKDDEEEMPIYHKMINNIDDILKILKLKKTNKRYKN